MEHDEALDKMRALLVEHGFDPDREPQTIAERLQLDGLLYGSAYIQINYADGREVSRKRIDPTTIILKVS